MNREQIIQRFQACRDAALRAAELSETERASFRAAVARETARAMERRRQQEPQMRLDEVA